jgi:phage shock protein E
MKNLRVNLLICLSCLAFGLISVSCSDESRTSADGGVGSNGGGSLEIVDVEAEAAAKLVADGAVAVLDVRTPEEFALGHIGSALNRNINDEGFAEAVKSLDPSKTYLVHCAMGRWRP